MSDGSTDMTCVNGDPQSSGCYCHWGWVGDACEISWQHYHTQLAIYRIIGVIVFGCTSIVAAWRLWVITQWRAHRRAMRRAAQAGESLDPAGSRGSHHQAAILARHKSRINMNNTGGYGKRCYHIWCRWYQYTDTQWWTLACIAISCALNSLYHVDPLLTEGIWELNSMTIFSVLSTGSVLMSAQLLVRFFMLIQARFHAPTRRILKWFDRLLLAAVIGMLCCFAGLISGNWLLGAIIFQSVGGLYLVSSFTVSLIYVVGILRVIAYPPANINRTTVAPPPIAAPGVPQSPNIGVTAATGTIVASSSTSTTTTGGGGGLMATPPVVMGAPRLLIVRSSSPQPTTEPPVGSSTISLRITTTSATAAASAGTSETMPLISTPMALSPLASSQQQLGSPTASSGGGGRTITLSTTAATVAAAATATRTNAGAAATVAGGITPSMESARNMMRITHWCQLFAVLAFVISIGDFIFNNNRNSAAITIIYLILFRGLAAVTLILITRLLGRQQQQPQPFNNRGGAINPAVVAPAVVITAPAASSSFPYSHGGHLTIGTTRSSVPIKSPRSPLPSSVHKGRDL
jgi:uncharacterized membrane protein